MISGKLEAHYQNRIFYFYLVKKEPEWVQITMYDTSYTFIKVGDDWVNAPGNRFNMEPKLIKEVIKVI